MKVGSHFLPSASKSFEYACRNGFMPAILSSLITLRRRVSRLTDRISSFFSSTLEFQSFFFFFFFFPFTEESDEIVTKGPVEILVPSGRCHLLISIFDLVTPLSVLFGMPEQFPFDPCANFKE